MKSAQAIEHRRQRQGMIYRFGNISLDTRSYVLLHDGTKIELQPQVFDLLRYLIENRARVVTREELLDKLWQGRVVSENALNGRLKAARKAVGDSGKSQGIIKTFHRRGYQFVAEVSTTPECADSGLLEIPLQSALFDKPSVAVLPFENLEGEDRSDHFASGLFEDISANLSRYRDLMVIHTQSAMRIEEDRSNIEHIARDLGVRYLASGSIRRSGNRVRIAVKLIEANSGRLVWGENMERVIEDIFALEDEVAGKIALNLASHIASKESTVVQLKSPESMGAYECVLRARKFDHLYGREEILEERHLLEQAIRIDPGYSSAHAQMACTYVRESEAEWCGSRETALARAVDHARKAEELDEYNSMGHMALGWAYLYQRKFDLAEACLDRAIECNPNDYDAYCIKGWLFAMTRRGAEVSFCGTRALQLNPLAPDTCLLCIVVAHYTESKYEKALDFLQRIRDPDGYSEALRAACLAQLGDEDQARDVAAEASKHVSGFATSQSWLDQFPFQYPQDLEHFISGLTKAGVLSG